MFSQNDEETLILEHFKDRPKGRLLDIGAYDGTSFSNSRALIEKGWKAVLVEASPWPFATMTKLWWDNPQVRLINGFVVPGSEVDAATAGLIKFLATEDAISCREEKTAQLWGREKFREVWIQPLPVSGLPKLQYDFVTIDVEDGTMPLVHDLIRRTRFLHDASLICLEHTAGGVPCGDEMTKAMEAIGRKSIHQTPENFLFT